MKIFTQRSGGRVIVLRLERGDLLRESIEEAIRSQEIRDGVLVSGYGTLDNCTLHMVSTATFPPAEDYPTWNNTPLELVSMTGVIAGGEIHIHAAVSDKNGTYSGHLEPGCTVLFLGEVVLYEHEGLRLFRQPSKAGPLELCAMDAGES